MNAHPAKQQNYFTLELVLGAVMHWIVRRREIREERAQLRECDPEELARLAREMGVSTQELADLVGQGAEGAELQPRMAATLGLDPESPALQEAAMARDLKRLCIACASKRRCRREIAAGTAAEHYREFCPNAYTFDLLMARGH